MAKRSSYRAVFLLHLCALLQVAPSSTSASSCDTLYLLHISPFRDGAEGLSVWAPGLQVIPAGRIATQHVNSHPDLLQGKRLEVIDIVSESCAKIAPSNGFVEVISRVSVSEQKCVFGVIGLYCSSVTIVTAPIFSHPNFGYIQLSSATSPLFRNTKRYPYLFNTAASSTLYNTGMVAIMAEFNWKKISVVFDPVLVFFRSTAMNLVQLISTIPDLSVVADVPIPQTSAGIASLFDQLVREESRVIYMSVDPEGSRRILCEAFRRGLLWPSYIYIFPELSLSQILSSNGNCAMDELILATEGIFLFQYRLYVNNDTTLVSGYSYQSYYAEYLEALAESAKRTGMELESEPYANILYDQVWAFAQAMNSSMDKIETAINDSFENIVNKTPDIRSILAEELRHISFQGATGIIKFGEMQEAPTSLNFHQVRKGQPINIAVFNSGTNNVSFLDSFDRQIVPPDTFKTVRYVIPLWLGITVIILQVLLLTLLLISIIALSYWRNRAEVKSTSLYISFVILIGCLLMCISPILYTVINTFTASTAIFTVFCNVDLWLSINGISIVVVALLFRLLRIVRVFGSYRSIGKYWSDLYLILYIGLTSGVTMALLLVWTAVDPLRIVPKIVYQPSARPPFYLQYARCSSTNTAIWATLTYSWLAVLLLTIVVLAIKTRHIKRKNFKDTKKVIFFIFSICIILAIFTPLSLLLEVLNIILAAYICKWLSYFSLVLICQLLLFLPKYVPLLYENFTGGRKKSSKYSISKNSRNTVTRTTSS